MTDGFVGRKDLEIVATRHSLVAKEVNLGEPVQMLQAISLIPAYNEIISASVWDRAPGETFNRWLSM